MRGQSFPIWKFTFCGALVVVAAAGCGGEKYELAAVRGQVTCEGKPVPGGVVHFAPVAEAGVAEPGPTATGAVDENGNFSLYAGEEAGAVVGRNHVRFELPLDIEGMEEEVASLEEDDDPEDLAEAKANLEAAKKLAANPINCREPKETEVTVAPGENVINVELAPRRLGPRGRPLDEDD